MRKARNYARGRSGLIRCRFEKISETVRKRDLTRTVLSELEA